LINIIDKSKGYFVINAKIRWQFVFGLVILYIAIRVFY
jgi:hypothetical protein